MIGLQVGSTVATIMSNSATKAKSRILNEQYSGFVHRLKPHHQKKAKEAIAEGNLQKLQSIFNFEDEL
jgi:hypothetical protein